MWLAELGPPDDPEFEVALKLEEPGAELGMLDAGELVLGRLDAELELDKTSVEPPPYTAREAELEGRDVTLEPDVLIAGVLELGELDVVLQVSPSRHEEDAEEVASGPEVEADVLLAPSRLLSEDEETDG
ncbi:MAG: nicotinate phosphoribosyltransferase [Watsoniomyces obsoletus]|nr:MAG: nicotinate phosphoribosyltransferase [Watsoniomyces obsoletus]